MKILKPSKYILLFLTAAFIGITGFENEAAAASQQPARSVRDIMARRGRTVRPAHVARVSKSQSAQTTPVSFSVADKDGSIFPGGNCPGCEGEPHDKDGSLFPGGSCVSCYNSGPLIDTGPCETCKEKTPVTEIAYTPYIYNAVARDCCSMAPLYLEHVDFRLNSEHTSMPYGDKLGNYRFRIFGCRRYDKEAVLNQGRILEKDMNFSKIFEEVTGDCYNLVKIPDDLCLQTTPSPLPEYILTAEITDFFMNVCDGYNWNAAQKENTRTGSAEMTVAWKLTNLTKSDVLWEGTTTGYSDLDRGETNGEIQLVESAFADAVSNLRNLPGFEDQLMIRLSPEELSAQRNALIDEEIALNPAKCRFQEELQCAKQCEITRPGTDIFQCPAAVETVIDIPAVPVAAPVEIEQEVIIGESSGSVSNHQIFDNCIDEKGGIISGGNCTVVDDTWVDFKNDIQSFDSLCIVDRPPYDILNAENLYKVRASVVEIINHDGQKGAGLIISESFVLTSANLILKDQNNYTMRTINGKELHGRAVRINPSKNTALIMLDQPTEYTPLSLNLNLPKVGQGGFMTLGILDVNNFADGENYIDNNGKVAGYRYSEDKGSEIMMDTFVQNVTIGGVLIDSQGTITGMAHSGRKTESGMDLFLPTETALRSVGLSICEKLYEKNSPWQQTVYKPVTERILKSAPKAPEAMAVKDRK